MGGDGPPICLAWSLPRSCAMERIDEGTLRNLLILCIVVLVVAGTVLNCTGTMADPNIPEGFGGEPQEFGPACDPDGQAPCPDDYFVCTENDAGDKYCLGQNPAVPDDGVWECYEEGTTMVCRGDHMPEGADDWTCVEAGGAVVCRSHAYVPHTGGDEVWNCWYEGEFRVCQSGEGTDTPEGTEEGESEGGEDEGETTDDGDDLWDDWFPDNDGNGVPDDFEDMPWDLFDDFFDGFFNDDEPGGGGTDDCLCVAGAWRYCDTPTYCRWGIQHCAPSGLRWGACVETSPPVECNGESWYSPEAETCCVEQGFCCQDMWDLDMDGDTWESLGDCTDIVCA